VRILLFGFAILLRILIGYGHHSGQDGYHGSRAPAYGGDFEAQRHWMELTIHLPVGDWYWYDAQYWGLDYPPLTAYVSWLCGWVSHYMVGPHSVALVTSRGIEDPTHKAFMRGTVLFLDVFIYMTAVWYSTFARNRKSLWAVLIGLVQPAILLIDHGHFQYNTVALGLSIWSFYCMTRQPDFQPCIWGGFLFTLALNFKQMTLYYAPVVFFYLLGRCLARGCGTFVPRILGLGLTVLATFYLLWEPFVKYGPTDRHTVPLERLEHTLRRIFPFQRGLFEGKVANLWCALNTSPIKIRDRIPPEWQPISSLALTLLLMLPSCYTMLQWGLRECASASDRTPATLPSAVVVKQHWVLLLWAATSCALSFFLAGFQVHEKSILLALAPCTLLLWQDPIFVEWFSFVCVWSLYPLLQVDRLRVAYWCTVTIFASLVWFRRMGMGQLSVPTVFSGHVVPLLPGRTIPAMSYVVMVGLHVAQALAPPPPSLPDLYDVLWSVAGCGMFQCAWVVTCLKLRHNRVVFNSAIGAGATSPSSSSTWSPSKFKGE
jgi:alpha-1,3-glucosyltransferase